MVSSRVELSSRAFSFTSTTGDAACPTSLDSTRYSEAAPLFCFFVPLPAMPGVPATAAGAACATSCTPSQVVSSQKRAMIEEMGDPGAHHRYALGAVVVEFNHRLLAFLVTWLFFSHFLHHPVERILAYSTPPSPRHQAPRMHTRAFLIQSVRSQDFTLSSKFPTVTQSSDGGLVLSNTVDVPVYRPPVYR